MTTVMIVGASIGAVLGLGHASQVYLRRVKEGPWEVAQRPVARRTRAAYFALWTLLLWVVFGTYIFVLWVISVVLFGANRVVKTLRHRVGRPTWR